MAATRLKAIHRALSRASGHESHDEVDRPSQNRFPLVYSRLSTPSPRLGKTGNAIWRARCTHEPVLCRGHTEKQRPIPLPATCSKLTAPAELSCVDNYIIHKCRLAHVWAQSEIPIAFYAGSMTLRNSGNTDNVTRKHRYSTIDRLGRSTCLHACGKHSRETARVSRFGSPIYYGLRFVPTCTISPPAPSLIQRFLRNSRQRVQGRLRSCVSRNRPDRRACRPRLAPTARTAGSTTSRFSALRPYPAAFVPWDVRY